MKVLIDIPENIIEGAKSSPNYYPTYHFEKIWKAIVNGTPIHDNSTNDDFFKAVLDEKGYRAIHDRFIGTKWLFAPYKGGE